MNANELRIGNFVGFKDREDLLYAEVNYIGSNGAVGIIRYFKNGEIDHQPETIEDITPIPLTEEWHLKLKDTPIFTDKQGFVIFKNHIVYAFTWDEYPFVHTLQNLYFALTGEELVCQ